MAGNQAFPVIESRLNLNDAQYNVNREAWLPVIDKYEASLHATTSEGNEKALKRHQDRGQLLGVYATLTLIRDAHAHFPFQPAID